MKDPASVSGAPTKLLFSSKVVQFRATNESPTTLLEINGITEPQPTLIDSGSSCNFIDISYARKHHIPLIELSKPQKVTGINSKELPVHIRFKCKVTFNIAGKSFQQRFYAMPTGE